MKKSAKSQFSVNKKPELIRTENGQIIGGVHLESQNLLNGIFFLSGWIIGSPTLTVCTDAGKIESEQKFWERGDVAAEYRLKPEICHGFQVSFIPLNKNRHYLRLHNADHEEKICLEYAIKFRHSSMKNVKEKTSLEPSIPRVALERINPNISKIERLGDRVLIVGSAPTIENYLEEIRSFDGVVWALNDAWFWLEKNAIKVETVFVTDTRFIEKSWASIIVAECKQIVCVDSVKLDRIESCQLNVHVMRVLGRDGFSLQYGELFHGCSVFFSAMQTAFSISYKVIRSCGVMLPPPGLYARISGSNHMPEYVFDNQLRNARSMMGLFRRFDVDFTSFESESNLNFL